MGKPRDFHRKFKQFAMKTQRIFIGIYTAGVDKFCELSIKLPCD